MTKKKKPCPFEDAIYDTDSGQWLCHLHHPRRTFRLQCAANIEARRRRRQLGKRRRPQ